MEERIKNAIERSMESLDDIDDVFEDFFENFPESANDAKRRSRNVLQMVRQRLNLSLRDADALADETQLQAHLGLMEARDRLEASRPVIEDFIEKTRDRSRQLLDEAQLQGHLAAMEAEDYWEREGREQAAEFVNSSDNMLQLVAHSIDDMQSRLADWAHSMRTARSS